MREKSKEAVDNGNDAHLVQFWLIFRKHLIALITHFYLRNFMAMEYHMHRLSWSFHILRIEINAPKWTIKNRLWRSLRLNTRSSLFNINLIDIFYEFDDSDIENYAGDTRSYTCTTHTDTVISKFQSTSDKLLLVSKITVWKASLKKCHRLLSSKTPTKSFFEDPLSNPAQKKHCLVSGMTPNFTLKNIFLSLCTNVSRKINAFDRITNFMLYEKRRLIIKAFIELQLLLGVPFQNLEQ